MPAWTFARTSERATGAARIFGALRVATFIAGLLPAARLCWLGANDALSANPLEFVTRSTGTWALVFLCLSLSMTPLRRLTGIAQWIRLRRMLGLYAFFYAALHFAIWVALDHAFDLAAMGRDLLRRPYLTAGFAALVMLVPLAVTSTRGMIRRLGANWVRLHRLVYLVAVAAILHFWWHKAGKNDFGTVSLYATVVGFLLGIRLWWAGADRLHASESARKRATHAK